MWAARVKADGGASLARLTRDQKTRAQKIKKEALGKVGSKSVQTPPSTFAVQTPLDIVAVHTPLGEEKGKTPHHQVDDSQEQDDWKFRARAAYEEEERSWREG